MEDLSTLKVMRIYNPHLPSNRRFYLFNKQEDMKTIISCFPSCFIIENAKLNKEIESYENIKDYTRLVIPFTIIRSPKGSNIKKGNTIFYATKELFKKLDTEAIKLIINKNIYENPCEFCKEFFIHVNSVCKREEIQAQCFDDLIFNEDVFEENNPKLKNLYTIREI